MNGDRCQQPQCTGTLEDDYCNLCGMAHPPNLSPVQAHASQSLRGCATSNVALNSPTLNSRTLSSRTLNSRTLNSRTLNSHRTARNGLGLGLVSLPPLPATDPESLLLQDPSVPTHKRFCGSCDHPVRRDRGFCGHCGQPYSFVPSLRAGDVVVQQYDVKGAIAYGGLGWIYLGFDRVLSRYVVLKGLLNSADASSAAVALAERQFLAAVKHPNIVGVYNFVTHENALTHQSEGFIVMEYVAGKTLRQLRRERGPLPVAEAIAYTHGILGAFGYLHDQGLVYCDFKPDNLMLEGQSVRLIDMGAVRRLDDPLGDIYGTVGYSAPEVGAGPTVVSDLFTVGRTLAVLVAALPGFSEANRYQLPSPDQVPLFAQWESLYRWLCKATAFKPEDRFQSAEEMAEQLMGVLREVVALEAGRVIPSQSRYFGGDAFVNAGLRPDLDPDAQLASAAQGTQTSALIAQLPQLLPDTEDPAYGAMLPLLVLGDRQAQLQALQPLLQQFPQALGLKFQRIQILMAIAAWEQADRYLSGLPQTGVEAWRSHWLRGKLRLEQGRFAEAQQSFDGVYAALPGEIAPRLALAQVAELRQDWARAQDLYFRVLQTDGSYSSAAFGLARCALAGGQRPEALAALQSIPASSTLYGRSRLDLVQLYLQIGPLSPTLAELQTADRILASLDLPPQEAQRQRYLLLNTALHLLETQQMVANVSIALNFIQPCRLTVTDLRCGLEDSLRRLAQFSQGPERIWLVDQANQVRARTWV